MQGHKRRRFNPWVGKIPWKRTWKPNPVFLAGESHGQRSLEGCSPWGCTESDTTEQLSTHTHLVTWSEDTLCVIWTSCYLNVLALIQWYREWSSLVTDPSTSRRTRHESVHASLQSVVFRWLMLLFTFAASVLLYCLPFFPLILSVSVSSILKILFNAHI